MPDPRNRPVPPLVTLDAAGLKITVEDADLEPEMVSLVAGFLENRRSDLATIPALLDTGAFAQVQRLGHHMKGCGTSYGFPSITRIGRELEDAAKHGDAPLARTLLQELSDLMAAVALAGQPAPP